MERKPCHPPKDSCRNLRRTCCEKATNDCIMHGHNKQATTTQKADPCAQRISLHNTIPGELAMQKAYQHCDVVSHFDITSQCAPRAQAQRPNPPTRFGLTSPVTVQQNGQQTSARVEIEEQYPGPIHALAKMAGQCPELSCWQAQCHPCGEGNEQAGTVPGHVQGREQGLQPSPESQGKQLKFGPSAGKKMDEGQGHQPWMLQIKSLDFESRPMLTAYPTARHHPFGGDYALEASTR